MIETPHAVAVVAVLCGVVLILTPVEGATEPRHAVAASPKRSNRHPSLH